MSGWKLYKEKALHHAPKVVHSKNVVGRIKSILNSTFNFCVQFYLFIFTVGVFLHRNPFLLIKWYTVIYYSHPTQSLTYNVYTSLSFGC